MILPNDLGPEPSRDWPTVGFESRASEDDGSSLFQREEAVGKSLCSAYIAEKSLIVRVPTGQEETCRGSRIGVLTRAGNSPDCPPKYFVAIRPTGDHGRRDRVFFRGTENKTE